MTSPSTLIRKAKSTPNPARAKMLRAQAAKLRREARKAIAKKAKKAKTSRAKTVRGLMELAAQSKFQLDSWKADPTTGSWQVVEPIISGDRIEALREYAAKKPKRDEGDLFADALRSHLVGATHRGRKEAEETHVQHLKQIHEINGINVVSAFIAEIEGIGRLNNGPLPPSLMVSGFTVARVVDALRDAGYTSEGKGGSRRNGATEALRNTR